MKRTPIFFAALLSISVAEVLYAATFTVDSTGDLIDASPGDGRCSSSNGKCTLRAAILEANALPGAHKIFLPAGVYTLTILGANEDLARTGDLDIRRDLTGVAVNHPLQRSQPVTRVYSMRKPSLGPPRP